MAFRRERGDSFIREELTLAIRNDLADPRFDGAVITDVLLTKDRRFARVYVSHYGGEEALRAALDGLENAKGVLRRHLAQVLAWRFTPELGFYADRAWEYGAKMDALIEKIEQEQATDASGDDASGDAADEDEDGASEDDDYEDEDEEGDADDE